MCLSYIIQNSILASVWEAFLAHSSKETSKGMAQMKLEQVVHSNIVLSKNNSSSTGRTSLALVWESFFFMITVAQSLQICKTAVNRIFLCVNKRESLHMRVSNF